MKLLDLSKMKKVATDGKTTTFEHDKGHKMIILHAALPKIQQEQIKRLALYRGGKVEKYADGTPDAPITQDDDSADSGDDTSSNAPTSHDTHITINTTPAAPAPAVTVAPPAQSAPQAPPAAATSTSPTPPAQGVSQPNTPSQDFALKQEAASQEALGRQQEIARQQAADIADFRKHTDDFAEYQRENPINPRAYTENMDADQKSKTAVGIFLGGLAGGGTSNMALDFLNRQLDRDVEAQKQNFQNRSTIYGAYQHLYDNEVVATNLAKASTGDILAQRMNIAAAQMGTPQAQKNNAAFQAQWQGTKQQLLQGAAAASSAPPTDTILRPGATLVGSQFNPTAQKDYPALQSQYDKAVQADKALGSLDATYDRMTKSGVDAENYGGYFHRQIAPQIEHIPVVGGVFKGLEKAATDNQYTREYDSAQSELFKTIRAALPEAGDAAIEDVVKSNSPERGDTDEMIAKKKKTIRDFIKRNTHTSLLDQNGLTNPR